MRALFLSFGVFFILISCQESENHPNPSSVPSNVFTALSSSATAPSQVHGVVQLQAFSVGGDHVYNLFADIYSDPYDNTDASMSTKRVDAGKISIGAFQANAILSSTNVPYYNEHFSGPNYDLEAGNTINFNVVGSTDFSAVANTSFYVPDEIHASVNAMSKSQGISLTWNADGSNPNGQFFIWAYYDYGLHGNDDPANNLPSNTRDTRPTFYQIVPDNGQFTIPPSALQNFPVGGRVDIIVGRGNYAYPYNSDGEALMLVAYSQTEMLEEMQQ